MCAYLRYLWPDIIIQMLFAYHPTFAIEVSEGLSRSET